MLVQLTIRDLGLIEEAQLDFEGGLQVISGETGVGKSLLLASMSLLGGDRPKSDWIRTGADEALVSGLFVIEDPVRQTRLAEILGDELEDGELLVERRLRRQGRHRSRLNGREVPASLLRDVGRQLIEIHGQQSQLSLLDPRAQLGIVDDFAGLETERREFATEFRRARALESQVQTLELDAEARAERKLSLEHLIAEIEEANPQKGERERLEEELGLLEGREQIGQTIANTIARFHDSERSLIDELSKTAREFQAFSAHRDLTEFGAMLTGVADQLGDGVRVLRAIEDSLELDPATIQKMGQRFDTLVSLEERFHRSGDDLIAYAEELREELEQLDGAEDSLPQLREDLAAAIEGIQKRARSLTRKRKKALASLSESITGELADLGMERATFRAERTPTEGVFHGLDESGADRVELIFGPNPGEPERPLREIASGGELSRVMLSLKRTLAEAGSVSTLVFDEIDTGVGGRLGGALGAKLQEIGARHQVLCVTHLAQLACYGASQHRVEKRVIDDRTVTQVEWLDEERRVEEIAQMMRGSERTERSLAEAREMMEAAKRASDKPAKKQPPKKKTAMKKTPVKKTPVKKTPMKKTQEEKSEERAC